MLDFSGVNRNTIIGKILRFPLYLIPGNFVCPILQGRLKGKKWIIGSSNRGCWLGSYEFKEQILFSKTVPEGGVVYDVGAHVGFYTLLSSELVGPKGKVFSFEPLPKNVKILKKHLRFNRCSNVTVIEAAVCEKDDFACFGEGINTSSSHLSRIGKIKVKTVSLDNLVFRGRLPAPDYIKIDCEGSEFLVLSGARRIIAEYSPIIFFSTHGSDLFSRCSAFLKSLEYEFKYINKNINDMNDMLAFKKNRDPGISKT